jgi:membrane protein insertase Oxa1/YidC/SpoIIIJ
MGFEYAHHFTGAPYAVIIVGTAALVRLVMFPIFMKSTKISLKISQEISPEVT